MKCPKDADSCNAYKPFSEFLCTRKKGHKGKHHAHNQYYQECEAVWGDEE